MTHAVEPRLVIEIHGVSHQDVPLPMPDRVSHPRGAVSGVMRTAIGKDLMPDGVVLEKHDDFAVRLNDLHGEGMKINPWQAWRNTSVVKGVVCFREGIRVRSKGRLGGFVLRLAPAGHGRFFQGELINPIPFPDSGGPGTGLHPNP